MKLSKKLIITLSVVFSVIAVFLILCWTLFALSSVSVSFESTTKNLNVTEEEIVEAGKFRYGATVLFEGKKKSIKNINEYASENENFAYIRVVNIETVFPNKFVIHVAEREELFAVEHESQFLICDRDFRVLRVTDNFVSSQDNAILLKGLKIEDEEIAVGDFLNIGQTSMKKFYSVMLQNNRDLAEQLGKFKEIELGNYRDEITKKEYISMTMLTFQNRKFVINNIDFAFANKMQKMFATESALFSQNVDEDGNIINAKGDIVYVVKTESGEYVTFDSEQHTEEQKIALTYQILQNCYIKVDNLTLSDYIDRTENDIYYSLVENQ